ncbi:hypothetical protein GQ607_017722 [Colletotrichum asianum]|uniref:C2H2-type domain-containing protein n=1 Tax=Colletotrichum asianum TaxID=702518 RepID=A0A8H3VVS9_9PEZI|nr:hypothetical protein GQ607_017722 [Colletotrichum asianum]
MDHQSRSIDETAVYDYDNDYYASALATYQDISTAPYETTSDNHNNHFYVPALPINQDISTAPYETTSDNHDIYYSVPTPAIDQNASPAPHQSYAGYGHDYLDQFADPSNHQFYADSNVNYASNNNFPPDAYPPELDLHTDLPNFTPSSASRQDQYSYPVGDPKLAWEEVKDRGHHTTSPWDPVPLDPTFLAPNYRRPPSTTYRTIASATRTQADERSQFTKQTPSDWDAVSSRSGLSVSSGATTCGACGKSFGDARVARRHETEVHHKDGDPEYVCKCNNYRVPSKRNYIRHVQGSCKGKGLADAVYVCKCLEQCSELDAHVAHVRACGKKKPGRPPNSSRTHSSPAFGVGGDQGSFWSSSGLFANGSGGV